MPRPPSRRRDHDAPPRRRRPDTSTPPPAPVESVAQETPTAPPAATAPPRPGRVDDRCYATGYCLQGTTATGLPVGPGIVAIDPTVIPLGTRMTIPGYGEGVAADTGGGIQGARIDVWIACCAEAARLQPHGHDHVPLADVYDSRGCPRPRSHPKDRRSDQRRLTTTTSRVLLVDDHDLFRTGLRNLLEEQQGIQVVGEGGERRRGRPARPRARPGRRRHGPEHAEDERRRGDAAHHGAVATDPRDRPDHLRRGRRRDGRDRRRRVRLPAQGRDDRRRSSPGSARRPSARR